MTAKLWQHKTIKGSPTVQEHEINRYAQKPVLIMISSIGSVRLTDITTV